MNKLTVDPCVINQFEKEFIDDTFELYILGRILLNLANSSFIRLRPNIILGLFICLVGEERAENLYQRHEKAANFLDDMAGDPFARIARIDKQAGHQIAETMVVPIVKKVMKSMTLETAGSDSVLYRRIQSMRQLCELGEVETEMLLFAYLIKYSSAGELFAANHYGYDFADLRRFKSQGHIPLGISRAAWVSTLSDSAKKTFFPVRLRGADVDIDREVGLYLSGVGGDIFQPHYYCTENTEQLTIGDFGRRAEEISILESLLMRAKSCNILLYGAPGAGKTSFARALVKHLGKELITAKVPDEDDDIDYTSIIGATSVLVNADRSVILIDEADEVLNSRDSFSFKAESRKSWINTFLDSHGKKMLWIVNRVSEIDPSSMRRFDIAIEFKDISESKRISILEGELRKRGLTEKVPVDEIIGICRAISVNADGILKAVSLFDWEQEKDLAFAIQKVRCILENHQKAIGRKIVRGRSENAYSDYSLDALNTSSHLPSVVSALKIYVESPHLAARQPFTMLFYGQPGTGKSEFVYYLGHVLGKKVILKRASDIISMWVGGTEANIARAFEDARDDDGILFFDEADSFLYPRQEAVRSWEKSQTNEMLTQLENGSGIIVFATNFIEGLDQAVLRRFRYKIEFKELSTKGITVLYESILRPLVPKYQSLTIWEKDRLHAMLDLTPGDFRVVRDQFQFETDGVTHEKLITALEKEVRHKKNTRKQVGFRQAV